MLAEMNWAEHQRCHPGGREEGLDSKLRIVTLFYCVVVLPLAWISTEAEFP